jgi:hypothetical protein
MELRSSVSETVSDAIIRGDDGGFMAGLSQPEFVNTERPFVR